METSTILSRFFSAIEKDPRIGISHIGLFVTLLSMRQPCGTVEVFSSEIMAAAKIASTATYQKLIHELHQSGYVRYQPSYYKGKPSRIYIIDKHLESAT